MHSLKLFSHQTKVLFYNIFQAFSSCFLNLKKKAKYKSNTNTFTKTMQITSQHNSILYIFEKLIFHCINEHVFVFSHSWHGIIVSNLSSLFIFTNEFKLSVCNKHLKTGASSQRTCVLLHRSQLTQE